MSRQQIETSGNNAQENPAQAELLLCMPPGSRYAEQPIDISSRYYWQWVSHPHSFATDIRWQEPRLNRHVKPAPTQ